MFFIKFMVCLAFAGPENSLTLEQAIELAVTRNERVSIADADKDIAEAHRGKIIAQLYPEISATSSYTRRAYEARPIINSSEVVLLRHNAFNSSIGLNMRLFDARSIPLLKSSKQEQQAATYEAQEVKRKIAFEAATLFMGVQSLEQLVKVSEERLQLAEQSHASAVTRQQAQIASTHDVTQAELELATARTTLTAAQTDLENAYLALGFLLNVEIKPPLQTPEEFLTTAEKAAEESHNIQDLEDAAKKRRPDVLASYKRKEQARLASYEAPLRWLPTLNVIGQARATNERGFVGQTYNGEASIALNWMLFDADNFADSREQNANYSKATLHNTLLERSVSFQIRSELLNLAKTKAAFAQAQATTLIAKRSAKEAAALYQQGLATALQTTSANVRQFESDIFLVQQRYALANAYLNLRAALGLDPLGREPQ